jgi:hypothetical protein
MREDVSGFERGLVVYCSLVLKSKYMVRDGIMAYMLTKLMVKLSNPVR